LIKPAMPYIKRFAGFNLLTGNAYFINFKGFGMKAWGKFAIFV